MKRFLLSTIVLCFIGFAPSINAQIHLTPYVETTNNGVDDRTQEMVLNRLNNIITANNGISASEGSRFILAAKLFISNKEIIASAPMKVIYEIEANFAVGDGIDGKCYGATTQVIKGVGRTETQALTNAIKTLNASSPKLTSLINNSKAKIIDYYNNNGATIIAQAKAKANAGNIEEAMQMLASIPQESVTFKNASSLLNTLFKKYADNNAEQLLTQAKALWASSSSEENAVAVANILANISPSASCYPQVKAFLNSVQARRQKVEDRNFNTQVAIQRAQLRTIENIYSAYAKSQPKVVYNVRGWW